MFIIFSFSSDNGNKSTEKSDSVIIVLCEKFFGRKLSNVEKEKYINYLVVPIRKSAHFLIYALLGLLIISFIKEYTLLSKRSIIITILLVLFYACSDEIHQLFVPGRSGEILDVFIDTTGGLVGCYLYYFIYKMRRRKYE